jgi:hypothetical protein
MVGAGEVSPTAEEGTPPPQSRVQHHHPEKEDWDCTTSEDPDSDELDNEPEPARASALKPAATSEAVAEVAPPGLTVEVDAAGSTDASISGGTCAELEPQAGAEPEQASTGIALELDDEESALAKADEEQTAEEQAWSVRVEAKKAAMEGASTQARAEPEPEPEPETDPEPEQEPEPALFES